MGYLETWNLFGRWSLGKVSKVCARVCESVNYALFTFRGVNWRATATACVVATSLDEEIAGQRPENFQSSLQLRGFQLCSRTWRAPESWNIRKKKKKKNEENVWSLLVVKRRALIYVSSENNLDSWFKSENSFHYEKIQATFPDTDVTRSSAFRTWKRSKSILFLQNGRYLNVSKQKNTLKQIQCTIARMRV